MASGRRKRRRDEKAAAAAETLGRQTGGGRAAFWLPLPFAAGVALVSFLPRAQLSPVLVGSMWVAGVALILWHGALLLRLGGGAAAPILRVELRSQHYIQAAVQLGVFLYWGYYWRPVYDHAWLLVAQIAFAYAFDMLLAWSRRDVYVLGFGPFPIIFSTNLFLWFRDDWFYLQFVLIAVGFLGKEFVRWDRQGRRVHIFNPSAFSLALFSLVLILTRTTELTWGQEIASTLTLAPKIYLFLFLVGLVVMYFFSITLVAVSAAASLFGASAAYSAATGVPYFVDSEIPAAVFLGLHLLVTDPSTSPRSRSGKVVFGALYGLGVFSLYALLGAWGVPTFYDKLLAVPLLNLSVRWIDRLVQRLRLPSLGWPPARANLLFMAGWGAFFVVMSALGATDATHRGDTIPFWERACADGRRNACERLARIESSYCSDNSGWACNELGRLTIEGAFPSAEPELAVSYFSKACELRFQAGCVNLLEPKRARQANPRALDLRLLLREGGTNLMDMPETDLYARACEHGWSFACAGTLEHASGGP